MQDEFETHLTRLFAEQREPLPDDNFMPQLLLRLRREYRYRQIKGMSIVVMALVAIAFMAPLIIKGSMALAWLASASVDSLLGTLAFTISGMLVALATVVITRVCL